MCGACRRWSHLLSYCSSQHLEPPSQLLETHCQSSAPCPLPDPDPTPGCHGPWRRKALESAFLGVWAGPYFLLAPRLTDCYLCCRETLIHVLLSRGCQLSTHPRERYLTCVLLCGGVCRVGWCMGSRAGAERCLLQTWTSVPRPCTTAAPARSVITCPAPTSAPAPTATARLGLNVWVSPGKSLSSPCSVP